MHIKRKFEESHIIHLKHDLNSLLELPIRQLKILRLKDGGSSLEIQLQVISQKVIKHDQSI